MIAQTQPEVNGENNFSNIHIAGIVLFSNKKGRSLNAINPDNFLQHKSHAASKCAHIHRNKQIRDTFFAVGERNIFFLVQFVG